MNAAVAIMARQKKYIRLFRNAGAINEKTAINPALLAINTGFVFHRLVRKRILVPVNAGRYYLDEAREIAVRKKRHKLILAVITILLAASIFTALLYFLFGSL